MEPPPSPSFLWCRSFSSGKYFSGYTHRQPPLRRPTPQHSHNSGPWSCCNRLLVPAVSVLAGLCVPTAALAVSNLMVWLIFVQRPFSTEAVERHFLGPNLVDKCG
jgi:hypothetical protein